MKLLLMIIFLTTSMSSFAKTGYEHILTITDSEWKTQKTPTGFAMICLKCENQVMVSADIVPANKNNPQTKTNEIFVNSLLANKNKVAESFAKDASAGGKVQILRADKSSINGKLVFKYMFLADINGQKSFDNTSLLLHKNNIVKITLNYFDGYFSDKDRLQVNTLYKSIKFTP